MADVDTELLDYEEEEAVQAGGAEGNGNGAGGDAANGADGAAKKDGVKGTYVSIHSSGFRDFLLKPEILRSIVDCGFEHPSEGKDKGFKLRSKINENVSLLLLVQHECIPQAVLGMDILCQAKSGMGKTAVFVLATLQQIEVVDGQVSVLVMCHTRELAFQISKEYERFSKYNQGVKVRFSFRLN